MDKLMFRFFFDSMSMEAVFLWKEGTMVLVGLVTSPFSGLYSSLLYDFYKFILQIRLWRPLWLNFFSSSMN